MPPKSKADVAKKQKQVEDKTFGLKNKSKSKAVQKYVQQLQATVQPSGRRGEVDPKDAQKKKKDEAAAREKELNDLFKVAITQPKVPLGVDPKSILCEFFKRGQCAKGFKCKYSHDLNVERKGEKINLYQDQRATEEEGTMEDWDQEKLEKVVATKGEEYANKNKETAIVCKYFLEAVEKKQYGWFWVCPNGGKQCMYRHALPPGYVLKSQLKALLQEEAESAPSAEESIEQERHALKAATPLTNELFMEWKRKSRERKMASEKNRQAERQRDGRLSGRELFLQDASVFVDDDEAMMEYARDDPDAQQAQEEPTQPATTSASRENTEKTSTEDAEGEDDALMPEDFDEDGMELEELEELEASLAGKKLED